MASESVMGFLAANIWENRENLHCRLNKLQDDLQDDKEWQGGRGGRGG
jgi:hypothetical protein